MKSIGDVNVSGKKVLVRVDYNVPIKDGVVSDSTRIKSSLETIEYLIRNKAKIILLSHLGRVSSEEDKEKYTLAPVASMLSRLVNTNVFFLPFTRGKEIEDTIASLEDGEILLIENTRHEDFPKKLESSCDESLSKYWSTLADMFVLDAFASAHRCHASTYGISKFIPSYSGFLLDKEVGMLSQIINEYNTFILGGSKVSDKIGLIEKLLKKTDYMLMGGAICFTFLKAKGYNVGKSIVDEEFIDKAKSILDKNKDKILLPVDFVIEDGIKKIEDMSDNDIAYDIGPKTIEMYEEQLRKSKIVLWNGPLGKFEEEEYEYGTRKILEFLNKEKIDTILAGGDIIAAANEFCIEFDKISTGGGASLEYLEGKKFKTFERLNGE